MTSFAVFQLPFKGRRNEFLKLRGDPRCNVRWMTPQEYQDDADVIILPGSGKTIEDLRYLREQGGDRILRHHLAQGKRIVGICAGYQMLGQELLDPFLSQGTEERVDGLGLLPVRTIFGPHMMLCETTQRLRLGKATGSTMVGVEARSGVTTYLRKEMKGFAVLASTQARDYNLDLDNSSLKPNGADVKQRRKKPAKSKLPAHSTGEYETDEVNPVQPPEPETVVLPDGGKIRWAPGQEKDDGLVSPDRQIWGTYLHLIFHNESFYETFFASMY